MRGLVFLHQIKFDVEKNPTFLSCLVHPMSTSLIIYPCDPYFRRENPFLQRAFHLDFQSSPNQRFYCIDIPVTFKKKNAHAHNHTVNRINTN